MKSITSDGVGFERDESMTTWTGVFPAVTTKLDKDGKVNIPATRASIDRLIKNGVSGVIVLPMLGENASLTAAEKESVVRAAKEVVAGRVPLMSGLAEITSDDATAAARNYQRYGAEGLMVFPSIGYKTDPAETADWYRRVGNASDLPIMIYNNPIAYGVDVTPEILRDLVKSPTIVAIKEESGDVRRVTDLYVEHGTRYQIFCGVDDQIVESMALGVVGWVSGMTNAWPAECVEIYNLCRDGKYAEARRLYHVMTPAFHLDTHVKLVQYIKFAEHLVYGAPEWTRPPRLPLVGEERVRVSAVIEKTIKQLAAIEYRKVG
jgi:4-hydroxy-tetrahydrodipicolinate synthase